VCIPYAVCQVNEQVAGMTHVYNLPKGQADVTIAVDEPMENVPLDATHVAFA